MDGILGASLVGEERVGAILSEGALVMTWLMQHAISH